METDLQREAADMNVITISREFGSGGRELGKRMADILGYAYYDREIISRIADEQGLDIAFVDKMLQQSVWRTMPITVQRSISTPMYPTIGTSLLVKEKQIIERIGKAGENCILVGRNADVYLHNLHPFSVFVCAETSAKLARCRERAAEGENLTDRELEKNMKRIDKGRASIREFVGGGEWGKPVNYSLTVNTTGWEIKRLAQMVAQYAVEWFEQNNAD